MGLTPRMRELPWALLLENGHVAPLHRARTRAQAVRAKVRWNEARRYYLAEQSIVIPRRAIGLVHFQPRKSPEARQLGSQGGKARAAKLSPKRRREIAQTAANARWSKSA